MNLYNLVNGNLESLNDLFIKKVISFEDFNATRKMIIDNNINNKNFNDSLPNELISMLDNEELSKLHVSKIPNSKDNFRQSRTSKSDSKQHDNSNEKRSQKQSSTAESTDKDSTDNTSYSSERNKEQTQRTNQDESKNRKPKRQKSRTKNKKSSKKSKPLKNKQAEQRSQKATPNKDRKNKQKKKSNFLIYLLLIIIIAILLSAGAGAFYYIDPFNYFNQQQIKQDGQFEGEINLNDFLSFEYLGYEGYASLYVENDSGEIYNVVTQPQETNELIYEATNGLIADEKQTTYQELVNSITYETDLLVELNNGDKPTVSISYNQELANSINISFSDINFTKKIRTLDSSSSLENETEDEIKTLLASEQITDYELIDIKTSSSSSNESDVVVLSGVGVITTDNVSQIFSYSNIYSPGIDGEFIKLDSTATFSSNGTGNDINCATLITYDESFESLLTLYPVIFENFTEDISDVNLSEGISQNTYSDIQNNLIAGEASELYYNSDNQIEIYDISTLDSGTINGKYLYNIYKIGNKYLYSIGQDDLQMSFDLDTYDSFSDYLNSELTYLTILKTV